MAKLHEKLGDRIHGWGVRMRWPWQRPEQPKAAPVPDERQRAWDALMAQLDEEREERRKLMDRLLVTAGQKPIYEPAPAPAPPAPAEPPKGDDGPAPERRVTTDDVHRWAREQMKKGEPPPRMRLN
jgi:hypothetical protein